MDFKDTLKHIADKIEKSKELVATEEATKTAFIMPFISALGYDVFNPMEVIPEMDCDLCKGKGEKIDYAIMKDNEPIMLIECKHWNSNLNIHETQLQRYYVASKAKFGVLTNGIVYRFYADLQAVNIMDEKPFLEIDITDAKDNEIEELKKFHKSYFNVKDIYETANELKYIKEIRKIIDIEFSQPSYEFVRFVTKKVYPSMLKGRVADMFTGYVSRCINEYINDVISERLQKAMDGQVVNDDRQCEDSELSDYESRIETTEEEIESYLIVKSILRNVVDVERIGYNDRLNYFSIVIDGSRFKQVCRMYLNGSEKYIAMWGENGKEDKRKIQSLNDIYNYADRLIEQTKKYIQ